MCNLFPQKEFYWPNPDSKFQTQIPYLLIHFAIHFRAILIHHQNEGLSFHWQSLTWESRMPPSISLLFFAWHCSFTLAPCIHTHVTHKWTIFPLYLAICKVHNTSLYTHCTCTTVAHSHCISEQVLEAIPCSWSSSQNIPALMCS